MKWRKLALVALAEILILAVIALVLIANLFADIMLHHPVSERPKDQGAEAVLAQYNLTHCRQITLTTTDGLKLAAWYWPSRNGAAVILLHGYKQIRSEMLPIAAMLARHGYGVMLPAMRGHGESDGELVTFGYYETRDMEAAFQYLLAQPEVARDRIGILGNSMGGAIAILYASQTPAIKAVVAQSPYTTIDEMVAANVKRTVNLPPFPMTPMIVFFVERKAGFPVKEFAPIDHIAKISPRPVFIMTGGKDTWVNPNGGRQLYAAAGEPRELWFDPDLGHLEFSEKRADEFEKRVIAFFDQYLARAQ